jgi:hypothetical protein
MFEPFGLYRSTTYRAAEQRLFISLGLACSIVALAATITGACLLALKQLLFRQAV